MKSNILLFFIFLFIGISAFGQQKITVTGSVSCKDGAILGATIKVKNSKVNTVSDMNGDYSINASDGDVLIFSFLGYKTVEQIVKSDRVNVKLNENVNAINEVVVTAIGIKQDKMKLGYATQSISTEALDQPGTLNVGNAMSGMVAGLTVDNPTGLFQAPSFTLRGKTPLIVVDGIPIETDLFDVSPANIESINVLKGTAAAALYGSRGKDGAIMITTKLAKQQGMSITANITTMVTAGYTAFPTTQKQFGGGSQGKYEFWDGADGGVSDGDMEWGPGFSGNKKIAQWNSPIRNIKTGETVNWWGDVSGSAYDDRSTYERVPIAWEYHNNLKDFLQTGIITKATFGISNKTNKSNYVFNGDFAKQKGCVPNTSVYTGGLNFNSVFNLTNNLSLSADLSYNKVYSPNYPRYGYGPKNYIYTLVLWMGGDVNGKELAQHLYRPDSYGTRQANYNYAWYNNPYFATYELTEKHDRNTINGQMKLNWDIFPGLSAQIRGAGHIKNLFEDMKSPKSYMSYSDSRNGDYKTYNTDQLDVNSDVLVTYTHAFNNNFNMTSNIGSSVYYKSLRYSTQSTDGLIVPRVYNMGNSLNPVKTTNSLTEKGIESVYGSFDFDFYKAVFLTVTGRNDWSSTLASGYNSYFYPSVSLSTLVSQYIKMPDWVDYLKASGAFAQVSSDLDPYSLYSTYSPGVLYGSTPSTTYPSTLKNSKLKPQKTTSFEVGLSTSFLKNRISLEATYYHMLDQNQILQMPVSSASEFDNIYVNGNEYATNGLEFIVHATPINNSKLKWNTTMNWSTNVKKLTKIYGGNATYNNQHVGDRADAMYYHEWTKSGDGRVILDATTGLPTVSPYYTNIGNSDPDWRFGFQNTFKYKKFSLDLNFDGALGGTLVSTTVEKMWWGGSHPKSTIYRQAEYDNGNKAIFVPKGVNLTGGSADYDSYGNITSDSRTYQTNTTAVNIQTWSQQYPYRAVVTTKENSYFANTFSRSYLKVRRIAISYDMTDLVKKTMRVKSMNLTLFCNNVAVLKKMPYIDPDFGASDGDLQDPSSRYIGLSANINF